jgi:Flp pilus assembly protein TadD
VVAINLSPIAERLPSVLRKAIDPAAKEDRKDDFEIPQAFRTVWHYRIHLPAGYQVKGFPDAVDRDLGPAHLTAHYKDTETAASERLVEAEFTFTLDHRTLSADQAFALRKAMAELRNQPWISLTFLPQGRVYLQNGKVAEGLAAFAAACKKNPAAPIPHVLYAMALIEEGMGEAARSEALSATKLDPKLPSAWKTLGFVLLHDLIGRQFSPGFDAAGAEQALRKASALDDADFTAKRNLAIVLEHDVNGERYFSKPRLEEAIKVYRGLGDELESNGLTVNLLYALAYAGHFDELKAETAKLQPGQVQTGLRLVALSQLDGTRAAVAESQSALNEEATRSSALETAASVLLALRKYDAAADLLTAAANGSKNADSLTARASVFRKIKPADLSTLKPDTPENSVLMQTVAL